MQDIWMTKMGSISRFQVLVKFWKHFVHDSLLWKLTTQQTRLKMVSLHRVPPKGHNDDPINLITNARHLNDKNGIFFKIPGPCRFLKALCSWQLALEINHAADKAENCGIASGSPQRAQWWPHQPHHKCKTFEWQKCDPFQVSRSLSISESTLFKTACFGN